MIVELINQHADRLTQVGLHFLWQGTAIAILAAILSRFLITNPRHRATLFLASLFALFLCVPLTLMNISSPPPEQIVTPPSSFETGIPTDHLAVEPLEMRPSAPSPLPISFWIAGVYFTGLFLMMVRVILGYRWCSKIRRHGKAIHNGPWHDALTEAISKMKLRSKPIMIWSEKVTSPVVTGILRPMIVLPISLMSGLPQDQAVAILSHELAHLLRFDHLIVVFQRFLEALFFFHPAVWFLSRRLDQEREKACDDLVLNTGSNRADYAEALVTIASDQKPSFALSAAGNKQLTERVLRILNHRQPTTVRVNRGGWLTIAAAITLLGVFSFSPVSSEEKKPKDLEKEEPAVIRKLDIKIPDLQFENVTLQEAVEFLRLRSIELDPATDPEQKGLNLVVRKNEGDQDLVNTAIDNLVARNFTIREALDAICMKTKTRYKVDEFAVVILPLNQKKEARPVVLRRWTTPPNFLEIITPDKALLNAKGPATIFKALGVEFGSGATLSYLKGSNTLIARNTPDNLELIDNIVGASVNTKKEEETKTEEAARQAMEAHNKLLRQRRWTTPQQFFEKLAPKKGLLESMSTEDYLKAHGVAFTGNASAIFDPKNNTLTVKNTPDNLRLIDSIIGSVIKSSQDPNRDKERLELQKKDLKELDRIIIPQVTLRDATLQEAVDFLRVRVLELDPTKQGFNINIFDGNNNLAKSKIRNLSLKNIPFSAALQYVCASAKAQYTVDGRNISILPPEE